MTGFHCPVEIQAGDGIATAAGSALRATGLGGGRVLLIVDPGCAGLDLHGAVQRGLTAAGFAPAVHAEGRPNPTLDHVAEATRAFSAVRADAIVAIGGGSTLDLAKGVMVAARVGTDVRRYHGGGAKIPVPLVPFVAIPTTAGSGSEVTPFAVFIDPHARDKVILSSPALYPVVALLDPVLLRTLPRLPLVAAAFDAVTHAVESFLGLRPSPVVDALALGALAQLWTALPACAEATGDNRPLATLLWGSTLAGMAVANGSAGIVQAIAGVLCARYDLSHGLVKGAVLAPVLRFLAGTAPARFARLAGAVGTTAGPGVPEAVAAFVQRLAPGLSLDVLGVPLADLPMLAAAVAADHQARFNSARAPDEAAVLAMLTEAF